MSKKKYVKTFNFRFTSLTVPDSYYWSKLLQLEPYLFNWLNFTQVSCTKNILWFCMTRSIEQKTRTTWISPSWLWTPFIRLLLIKTPISLWNSYIMKTSTVITIKKIIIIKKIVTKVNLLKVKQEKIFFTLRGLT